MKILNFGSMNIDYVYSVDNFVLPGETKSSKELKVFSGGKGLNQSLAIAKAGAKVYHAGIIGQDGDFLKEELNKAGVNINYIEFTSLKNGHAVIQVDAQGHNCILLYGGSNQCITKNYVDRVLSNFDKDDIILLQNEINLVDYIIDAAFDKGMKIILNPSPINERLSSYPLEKVSLFLLNEIEGKELTGEADETNIVDKMQELFPASSVILTFGEKGAVYKDKDSTYYQEIYKVKVVDTTAAGDTFTGYFIAGIFSGLSIQDCLKRASAASALSVSRHGAALSIPYKNEVDKKISSFEKQ